MNENLNLVAEAGIDLGMYAAQVFEDGKISPMEGFGFLPKLMSIPGIIEKKEQIKAEWESRTTESLAALNSHIQAKLSLPGSPALEAKIEKSVSAALAILDLVDAFKKPAEAA